MSSEHVPQSDLREEADSAVTGPGVVATKSQTQGGVIGTVIGTIAGAILGLIVSPLFGGGGFTVLIAVIVFAIAGATAGGTAGGFLRNRKRMERGEPDV